MPAARASWAMRATEVSTSFAATIMRSAISSMMQTMYGSFSFWARTPSSTASSAAATAAASSSGLSASSSCLGRPASLANLALKPVMFFTPHLAKIL